MKRSFAFIIAVLLSLGAWAGHNPDDCITFTSAGAFTLKTNNGAKNWDGTLYWSTDKATWTAWTGTEISAAQTDRAGDYHLYLYGTAANTKITGCCAWILTPAAENTIACSGNIETLRGASNESGEDVLLRHVYGLR